MTKLQKEQQQIEDRLKYMKNMVQLLEKDIHAIKLKIQKLEKKDAVS